MGETSFSCTICNRSFLNSMGLSTHMVTHKEKCFLFCSICEKTFQSRSTFTKHLNHHIKVAEQNLSLSKDNAHTCIACGKVFELKHSLKRHMRAHTSLYQCVLCNKCFSTSSNLSMHMITHSEDAEHNCSTCGKCFKRKSDLKRHIRIHTGERPYQCELCDKCFSNSSSRSAHMKRHIDNAIHVFSTCDKRFNHKVDLKRQEDQLSLHMKIENKEAQSGSVGHTAMPDDRSFEADGCFSKCTSLRREDNDDPISGSFETEDNLYSMSILNETNLPVLHFSKNPFVMDIKIEDDL